MVLAHVVMNDEVWKVSSEAGIRSSWEEERVATFVKLMMSPINFYFEAKLLKMKVISKPAFFSQAAEFLLFCVFL